MPAAGAIATVAGSALSYQSASEQADAADANSRRMQDAQMADLAFRKQLYQDFLRDYDTPLLKPLREKLAGEGPLDLGQNWAAIQRNFDRSGTNVERALARGGMLGSGYTPSAAAGLEMGRATALSDAYDRGLKARDAGRLQMGQFGKALPQQATNLSQGYQNASGMYGGLASQNAAGAASAWGNVGGGLQTIGENWGKWFGSGSSTAPAAAPPVSVSTPGTSTATQARVMDANAMSAYAPPTGPIIPQAKQDYSVWQPTNPDSWDK